MLRTEYFAPKNGEKRKKKKINEQRRAARSLSES